MLDLIGTAAGGGVLGLIGSAVHKGFSMYELSQAYKEKALERQHQLRLIELEHKAKLDGQYSEERIAYVKATGEIQQGSYLHDTGIGVASQWVINTLRMVRPSITILLILFLMIMWTNPLKYEQTAIETMTTLASMCVSWWFGSRTIR